jgi:riboflavin transporter FmnP
LKYKVNFSKTTRVEIMEPKVNPTARLTGTAILAALVLVFDYTLKYSGLKIPFPWFPDLKFDFTGVPIALSLLMYGLPSATTTSMVAGLGILARSGNLISASMKTAAELSTVVGFWLGLYLAGVSGVEGIKRMIAAYSGGILCRVVVMSVANIIVLPNFWGVPIEVAYGLMPLIAGFNVAQGLISLGLGSYLFDAVKKRLPH